MLKIELYSTPQCRRYQRMRTVILEAAVELGLEIELEEFNLTDQLSQSNPLDSPRLYLNGELIAVRKPPKSKTLMEQMHSTSAKPKKVKMRINYQGRYHPTCHKKRSPPNVLPKIAIPDTEQS